MDAVIDKVNSAIDVAKGREQALASMCIVDRGPVEDRGTGVHTVLTFETCAAVLDFLVATIKDRCSQASNNLTAI
jgi:hypothetical protein